jgi:hypothetical protein
VSTVDPRRAGDVLPLGCDCRPPKHIRGINRCSDRDVDYVLGDRGGETVMVVVVDEVHAPPFGDPAALDAAIMGLGLPDGVGIDEVKIVQAALPDVFAWQVTCRTHGWRGIDSARWGHVVADARWHATLHEERP